MSRKSAATTVRLKPADSFDLIRVLARSQHEPRKAVCELVQNSLDAQAQRIELTWFNDRRRRALRIWDDGEGVFPGLPREQALLKIAQTIGHSHKRRLDPVQRRRLMMLGQYGIGLLGFWSVGRMMEIRSRVNGGDTYALRLIEDAPEGQMSKVVSRHLAEAPTFTQITIHEIHEGAARQIRPARLQAYLASELRGQLLKRQIEIVIRDRVARGRALKQFRIQPVRFHGVRLDDLQRQAVPGYEDAQLELYLLAPEIDQAGRVMLACGGTTVLDDMAHIDGPEALREPWSAGRLEGVVDFADLTVAPGTRRGFQRDAAAVAFVDALPVLEDELRSRINEEDRRRAELEHQNLARRIRKAFLSVAANLLEYDLFEVRAQGRSAQDSAETEGAAVGPAASEGQDRSAATEEPQPPADQESEQTELFPPGPLAAVRITPATSRIEPGGRRTLRARAMDQDGRAPTGDIDWHWQLSGPGDLNALQAQAEYTAPVYAAQAQVQVQAVQGGHHAEAEATVQVVESLAGLEKVAGIPEPQAIHAPLEPWRSRMRQGRWEFNSGHRDYQAACQSDARRLRYFIHLFAKELVLRNFGGSTESLERMVEVLTYLGNGRTG